MGKWFSNLVAALVLLALTTLLGALLKGPIDGIANQSRLTAEVQLSPWVPKPDELDSSQDFVGRTITKKDARDLIEGLDYRISYLSDFGFAKMNIENGGADSVSDISVRVTSSIRKPQVIFVDANENIQIIGSTDRVKLPDMEPGDRITLFYWGRFNSYNVTERFKTYSSEGEFRISYEWPEARDFEYRSGLGQFLDDYAWTAFVIVCLAIVFLVSITLGMYQEYVKGLMVSPKLREDEAAKFLENPKLSQIDVEAAQAAWRVFKGKMDEEVKETEEQNDAEA